MTPQEKDDLTKSKVGRMMDERIKVLQEAQAKRDAEQDAKLSAGQRASRALGAVADAPSKSPVAFWFFAVLFTLIGCACLYATIVMAKPVSVWIGVGFLVAATCCVPGVMPSIVSNAKPALGLWKAFKKAKE
jgi:hypothetical protein